jgi:hypothetical protein
LRQDCPSENAAEEEEEEEKLANFSGAVFERFGNTDGFTTNPLLAKNK